MPVAVVFELAVQFVGEVCLNQSHAHKPLFAGSIKVRLGFIERTNPNLLVVWAGSSNCTMSKVYRDDVTGEEHDVDVLSEFGLVTHDGLMDKIDVHDDTVNNQPEEIADELHAMVDNWLEDWQQHLENESEYLTECQHCGYKWEYTGTAKKATCPSCGNKTPAKA